MGSLTNAPASIFVLLLGLVLVFQWTDIVCRSTQIKIPLLVQNLLVSYRDTFFFSHSEN